MADQKEDTVVRQTCEIGELTRKLEEMLQKEFDRATYEEGKQCEEGSLPQYPNLLDEVLEIQAKSIATLKNVHSLVSEVILPKLR